MRDSGQERGDRSDLIGREDALEAIAEALRGDGRIISIIGPGGVGKTRLAQAWCAGAADAVRARLDASGYREVDELWLGLGAALDVAGAEPDVCNALADTRGVLVIDNLEPLLPAAAGLLTRVLAAAPGLRMLVTSRERVGVTHERVVRLSGLADGFGRALYRRAAGPACPWSDASIEALVRAVDGLPLAIELAAARGALLDPDTLRSLLEQQVEALGTDPAAAHDRGSMQAVLQTSWSRLDASDQRLLGAMTVLTAAFAPMDLEAVTSNGVDVYGGLERLLEASWVEPVEHGPDGRPGYRLLELARTFARAHVAPEVVREARRRRGEVLLSRLEDFSPTWSLSLANRVCADVVEVFRELEHEDAQLALRLLVACTPILRRNITIAFAVRLLDRGQALAPSVGDSALEAELVVARTHLQVLYGSTDGVLEAEAHLQRLPSSPVRAAQIVEVQALIAMQCAQRGLEARALEYRMRAAAALGALDTEARRASVTHKIAIVDAELGRGEASWAGFEALLAQAHALEDRELQMLAEVNLSSLALRCFYDRAADHLRVAEALLPDVEANRFEAITTYMVGVHQLIEGELSRARASLERSLNSAIEHPQEKAKALATGMLGVIDLQEGDVDRARRRLEQARARLQQTPYRNEWRLIGAFAGFAHAAAGADGLAEARYREATDGLPEDADAPVQRQIAVLRHGARPEDLSGLEVRVALRLVGASASTVTVAADGAYVDLPDGRRLDFSRSRQAKRVLLALAQASGPLSAVDLFEQGWPGVDIDPDKAAHRVYEVVRTLRRNGLEDWLATSGDGYALRGTLAAAS